MPPQSTLISERQLIDAARSPLMAFNQKNWNAVRSGISPDFVYDEVPTGRKAEGADQAIAVWQGWATAFPDVQATFDRELPSGNVVVFEVTWRGTHQGPLQTPGGAIPPTVITSTWRPSYSRSAPYLNSSSNLLSPRSGAQRGSCRSKPTLSSEGTESRYFSWSTASDRIPTVA
jgi:hypothetical protein